MAETAEETHIKSGMELRLRNASSQLWNRAMWLTLHYSSLTFYYWLYSIGCATQWVWHMQSASLSVRYTCESHLNGTRYQNTFCIMLQGAVSSFLQPNFHMLNVRVHHRVH